MVASCPSLRCSCKKDLSHAQKQSVWSRSCGLEDLLQYCDICDCALSCAMRLLQINEHLSRLSFQQQWVGSGAASLSAACSQNVTHCRKEICSTCLFKTSIPAVPFWNSTHPLPTRSLRLKVAESGSTLHQLCTMVASFPSLRCSCRKSLSYAQKWLCPRFGLQDIDCALSCDMWLLQTNEP